MKRICYALLNVYLFCMSASLFADDEMPPRDQGLWQTLVMLIAALVLGYFILWRPEQKRRKMAEEQRGGLKKGDRVTAMGIIGTVLKVQDSTVILKMVDGSSKIEVLKGAITDVHPGTEEDAKE
jgi:preprotein translocase subunit YajC